MHFAKENTPGIEPEFSAESVEAHHARECKPRHRPALLNFFEDAFVDEVEKLRHHGKSGDIPFAQCSQQFCSVER